MESITKLQPDYSREIKNPASGLHGYVVIDRQINGAATGGIRMASNVTLEEVANLAHEMTLKYATFKIKKDGAKAGIIAPDAITDEQKKEICMSFGKEIGPLIQSRRYFPGQDLGIHADDLAAVYAGAGINTAQRKSTLDSGYCTALTVYLAIREILRDANKPIQETTFVIEGFGKVGEHLAVLIMQEGGVICGVSTAHGALYDRNGIDIRRLRDLKRKFGDDLVCHYESATEIKKEELILKQADVCVPGARPDSITLDNLERLNCRFIVPIANIAATEAVEESLFQKGIIFVPGFVANAGGILGYYFEEQGFRRKSVEQILAKGFPLKMRALLKSAGQNRQSMATIARQQAAEHLKILRSEQESSLFKKLSFNRLIWVVCRMFNKVQLGTLVYPISLNYMINKHFK